MITAHPSLLQKLVERREALRRRLMGGAPAGPRQGGGSRPLAA